MPKTFYTEKDIEDLVKRGVMSLEVNDNVVLTDLAYEKANRLGVKLVRDRPENPPGAPVRPYISNAPAQRAPEPASSAPAQPANPAVQAQPAGRTDLHQRIKESVIARLGKQVDPTLLDTIIKRVLASTGVK
ncbi:MAG: hypothetical protein EHM70_07430 [Chloroflexota bacterium]|nr:MAG: hypothetical protein EHM70_07430 [Chloroflexota bacterium]